MLRSEPDAVSAHTELDAQTIALRIIAGVLVVGLLYLMGTLLVPFVLALILAIALSPAADWLQRRGLARGFSNLICTLFVLGLIAATTGLIVYQAGSIVQQADTYTHRMSHVVGRLAESTGADRLLQQMDAGSDSDSPAASEGSADRSAPDWDAILRRHLRVLGRWLAGGLGGLLGVIGGVVLLMSFLFYMLETRADWLDRIVRASESLGLRPRRPTLERIRHEIVTFIGCLSLVSLGYTVIVSLGLWLIGVPQPLLWGILAGLLEVVPYFGPLIAAVLPTLVALTLGTWWQPLAVIGQYLALHTIEGYVVTPLLYGGAVKVDPVLVLVAVLFFGWLWGPLGLTVAMPVTLLLRGLLDITPDTPALDALLEPQEG